MYQKTIKIIVILTAYYIIDVRDVTAIKQYVTGLIELDEQSLANSDVIKDNIIDVKDLGQLLKYMINLIDTL